MDRLTELNGADESRTVELLEPLIERAPQIASQVAKHRPFQGPEKLSEAIRMELLALKEADKVRLFKAHPELAPENPLPAGLEDCIDPVYWAAANAGDYGGDVKG